MERVQLTPPGKTNVRGSRARLYIRWMPHLGAGAVALYELLRTLPDVGLDAVDLGELAELLRATPESVEESLGILAGAGFLIERDGWVEVTEHPPVPQKFGASTREVSAGEYSAEETLSEEARPGGRPDRESARGNIEVVRAEPEGVTPDDYFRFMGNLPAPHILEFLNSYCGRDGVSPDVVREALKIASERDARRVGYVRSILERWVERGVKTVEDVERFEQDRRLRLVEESGAVKGGALRVREGVTGGEDRGSAARRREGYEWFFGE